MRGNDGPTCDENRILIAYTLAEIKKYEPLMRYNPQVPKSQNVSL